MRRLSLWRFSLNFVLEQNYFYSLTVWYCHGIKKRSIFRDFFNQESIKLLPCFDKIFWKSCGKNSTYRVVSVYLKSDVTTGPQSVWVIDSSNISRFLFSLKMVKSDHGKVWSTIQFEFSSSEEIQVIKRGDKPWTGLDEKKILKTEKQSIWKHGVV